MSKKFFLIASISICITKPAMTSDDYLDRFSISEAQFEPTSESIIKPTFELTKNNQSLLLISGIALLPMAAVIAIKNRQSANSVIIKNLNPLKTHFINHLKLNKPTSKNIKKAQQITETITETSAKLSSAEENLHEIEKLQLQLNHEKEHAKMETIFKGFFTILQHNTKNTTVDYSFLKKEIEPIIEQEYISMIDQNTESLLTIKKRHLRLKKDINSFNAIIEELKKEKKTLEKPKIEQFYESFKSQKRKISDKVVETKLILGISLLGTAITNLIMNFNKNNN